MFKYKDELIKNQGFKCGKIYIGEKDIYPHKSIESKIYKNK